MKREKIYRIDEQTFKRERELTDQEKEYKDALPVVDETYETDIWSTSRNIIEKVAANMNKTVNFDVDDDIIKFVEDFSKMSWEDRILYGLWSSNTKEYRAQQLMKSGKSPEEALKEAGLRE